MAAGRRTKGGRSGLFESLGRAKQAERVPLATSAASTDPVRSCVNASVNLCHDVRSHRTQYEFLDSQSLQLPSPETPRARHRPRTPLTSKRQRTPSSAAKKCEPANFPQIRRHYAMLTRSGVSLQHQLSSEKSACDRERRRRWRCVCVRECVC